MLGADRKLIEKVNQMIGDKIIWVFEKFSPRQATNQITNSSLTRHKQCDAGNHFQNSIESFQDNANFEREMKPFSFE